MNEQIKQLLDQAQDLARAEVKNTPELAKYAPSYAIPGTEIHVGLRLSYEKFAELIVKECGEWFNRRLVVEPDYGLEHRVERNRAVIGVMKEFNQHFGVEE